MARAATALGEQSRWSAVAVPLNQFCRAATRSAENVVPVGSATPDGGPAMVWRWGGVRQDFRIVAALLRDGGPRLALAQALARVRRLRRGI